MCFWLEHEPVRAEQGQHLHAEGSSPVLALPCPAQELWHSPATLSECLIYIQVSPNPWASCSPVRALVSSWLRFLYPEWICTVFACWQLKNPQFKTKDIRSQGLGDFSCLQVFVLSSCSHPAHRGLAPQVAGGFVALLVVTIRRQKQVLFFCLFHTVFVWKEKLWEFAWHPQKARGGTIFRLRGT